MVDSYEAWMDQVRDALRSINMRIEDWQPVWSFEFKSEYEAGTSAGAAAMKANHFWWLQQNKSMGQECDKLPGCWLPRKHQGECQPIYEPGDYIKVEFEGNNGMPGEWMWVRVEHCDAEKQLVFGTLDNEPVVNAGDMQLGRELAVSYSQIREHRKPSEFRNY